MRLFLNVSAVLVCGALAGVTALAQSAPSRAASIQSLAVPMAGPDTNELAIKHGGGVETHFDAANTSHDGHLTKAQADANGWKRVVKHFDEIDTDHKGWVSVDQIHAYNKSHRKHRKDTTAA